MDPYKIILSQMIADIRVAVRNTKLVPEKLVLEVLLEEAEYWKMRLKELENEQR